MQFMTNPLKGTGTMRQLFAAVALVGTLACSPAHADNSDAQLTEYRIKSAFLYNFTRFVTWPEAAKGGPVFNLCVLGADPFGNTLDALEGKKVDDSNLAVRRHAALQDTAGCQLVYVNVPPSRLNRTMDALAGKPVLTVSDMAGFTEAGGIIKFKLVDNKIRFDINIDAARQSDLSISSKLLSLATIVRSAGRPAP